ncbi:class I SAM-dependent methyltransferase [Methylobacterium frigidaeris]|uniref:Ubiquinone biosynthesis O-methyltransferase, mitochondrial n=1 Tax=Methylobacterium frigidaeris TaxID=2038277 RepID=A0AA37HJI6_9HYPH|nr:class I SAM-dependent methyltransferase [Methylobacterium frigidaeris]PIK74031.1 SAM-dependent methyltransferase [Methylobacterium frigidaeris]GJD66300.1 Ubiquinone biosynthesis O-methyltransferase, mitochondrial [Methylobacterium frigidaeris]
MQTTFAGHCVLCENDTTFELKDSKTYRSMQCIRCGSVSRNRALWFALNRAFPKWRQLVIHESSPGWDIVSRRLAVECTHYVASQYEDDLPLGHLVTGTKLPCKKYQVENLEKQTFKENMFDLVITQDVFEHVFDPLAAIADIARTLKPGGSTLMSVPVVRRFNSSRRRARLVDGKIEHLLEPEYHGNPVSGDGALVTVDWGYDISSQLSNASGMYFVMQTFENMDLGIRDECNQILIGYKAPLPDIN